MTEPNAYDDTDLLNYAIQTGIISLDTMLNDIEDMEKKERRKSIYSTCKENYKKRKKCLQFMGKSCIVSICQR